MSTAQPIRSSLRLRPRPRSAPRPRGGAQRLARATVTAVPFPSEAFDLVTSFDVLYALEDGGRTSGPPRNVRLLRPGGYALINVAAMEVLRGDHSVLSHERAPLQPRRSARPPRAPPVSTSYDSPTPTPRCSCRWCWAGPYSAGAGSRPRAKPSRTSRSPPIRSTHC